MAPTLMDKDYILLVWLLAGIITLLGSFNVAGLATMTDESGGIYEYLRLSFGNFFSFISGWDGISDCGQWQYCSTCLYFC